MNENPPSLLETLRQGLEQQRVEDSLWEGSFKEYLEIVEQNPLVARNAWQRLLDMIESHGFRAPQERGEPRRWKLFDDPFDRGRDAVYGLDEPIAQLVQTVRAGAQRFGPEKRALLLHGPVGSAKSTIVRLLKRGLEAYSQRDEGALYTFCWEVDGESVMSPMHQDPLLLIPHRLRSAVEQSINRAHDRDYGIEIDGELDPVSRYYYRMLLDRHDGVWSKVVEHVRVHRFLLS